MTRWRRWVPAVGALGCAVAACLLWGFAWPQARDTVRETAFDAILPRLVPPMRDDRVVVVDIDRESLSRHGAWPWSRLSLAALLAAVAQAKPAVIAIDILLDEPDRHSPAALARRLAEEAQRPDLAELAKTLPDGDAAVAAAVRSAPTVLGLALDSTRRDMEPPPPIILVSSEVDLSDVPRYPGVIGPPMALVADAAGTGVLALEPDRDGPVRRVPLLVVAGEARRTGLAVAAARVFHDIETLMVEADPPRLRIEESIIRLDPQAQLRLILSEPAAWEARTIPAWSVLANEPLHQRLTGKIVLVGGSAPELGGLRTTAMSRATPSVQIHADAVATLLAEAAPVRRPWMGRAELAGALILSGLAILFALGLRPLTATLLTAGFCAAWVAAAAGAFAQARMLIDLVAPPALGLAMFAGTSLASFAMTERRGRALRRRFEQHLSAELVTRLAENPNLLRLEGEQREVTVLFTDIEGFTAMTERAEPRDLVSLLDGYMQIATDVVVRHGGMVEKIVGDGLHALFNAPLDLPDHPRHALACALALVEATENYRATPLAGKLALGRTRIGIETGPAIVGDIGGGGKLDYTAHGTVTNTAARLEQANKELGTAICIGPMAAARLTSAEVVSSGMLDVRGRSGPIEVFRPA